MRTLNRYLLSLGLISVSLFAQEVEQKETVTPPVAGVATVPVAQGDVQFDQKRDPDVDDMEALRRWIRDKRFITVKEIGGDLSISGDVRTEFQDTSEIRNGVRQRGKGSDFNKPQYAWDIEVNLMIDYRTDRTWAAIKIEFDNDMGTASGTVNHISLEKAYLGGRIIPGDTFTFDAELGRRNLFNVYDSKIEFSSLFDGVLFRLSKAWESVGDFYINPAVFLINDRTNHYAFVTEIGALRIANVGLNMKYSLIDWYKPAANELQKLRYKFLVSQFLTYYQFYPEWLGKRLIKFYGAALTNHLAAGIPITHNQRQNWAWYTGMTIGLVRKQYDFSIDVNYQWCQAQVVPDFDNSGIGRGNAAGVGFYTNDDDGDSGSGATTAATAVGEGNFKGFEVNVLYAFTDNLTVFQSFKYSNTLNKSIGPNLSYKQYEAEFIYAF